MIYESENMPYTKDGIVPDIIMNPHAFPSRMTFAQFLESLLGIECLHSGMHGDGTPFTDITVENLGKRLEEHGLNPHGEMELYSGETGKKIQGSVFMGPVFYQRLKHMVEDKIHARATGPIVNLTRQPSEGRARDGGLRVGEMERDAMLSHGASQFIREKMMELSDNYTIHTNKNTGFMCAVNKKDHVYNSFSSKKGTLDPIAEHRVPYALKLMVQELQTMGVAFHFKS
jgi:DNA-directed RNA polymerase II subunit RPB2